MDLNTKTAAALLAAARAAGEGAGANGVLRAAGLRVPNTEERPVPAVPAATTLGANQLDQPLTAALCLGFLAGLAASRRRPPRHDVTAFLMDKDLLVRAADGDSILRLPWFELEMFVGRQLPDAVEIPPKIRSLAVDSYRAALNGTPTEYAFTSYGHSYSVDAVPLRDAAGRIEYVMAIATPGRSLASAVSNAARSADRLQQVAHAAEARGQRFLANGRRSSAALSLQRAEAARQAADRARRHADRLAAQHTPVQLTQREREILTLASHGCSYTEIAEQLVLATATVKTHLRHCYTKLAAPDKAAAVATALRYGLID